MIRSHADVIFKWASETVKCAVLGALAMQAVGHYVWPGLLAASKAAGLTDRAVFILTTMLVHESMYFLFNGSFILFARHGIFQEYQIPRKEHEVPDPGLVRRTLRQAAFSHFVMQPLSLYVIFPAFQHFGAHKVLSATLPPFTTLALQFALALQVNDAGFYWTHRLLHTRLFYKRFHKQHHEYIGTIGFAAEYAHPVEALLSNQLPTILVPLLSGMHLVSWAVFLGWRVWRTYETHTGFAFFGTVPCKLGFLHAHGAVYHDYHHTHNVGNYGGPANGFWDHFCGTQDSFLRYCDKHLEYYSGPRKAVVHDVAGPPGSEAVSAGKSPGGPTAAGSGSSKGAKAARSRSRSQQR